jgi:hypothetical protein
MSAPKAVPSPEVRNHPISHHIFPTSASMVGACLTTISILRLVEISNSVTLLIDSFLALNSLVFLSSSVISYLSIRSRQFSTRLERIADLIFLIGLSIMVVIGFMLTYEFGILEIRH